MTQATESALRKALNQVDRERRRATAMLYALLLLTFGFWAAMIFAKNDHSGLPYGLAAVIGSVFVAGMMASRASHENTRAILKAIELLVDQNQNG
jgi:peptidoglycan/LPS O-acetylase OafA/YrhL